MDDRIRKHLENELGLSLQSVPYKGINISESPKRTDKPGNRLLIYHILNRDGVLITAIPRIIDAIIPVAQSMSMWELFSPLGIADLQRVLQPKGIESLFHGFDYTLTDKRDFRPAVTSYVPVPLTKSDIPSEQFDLRMSERKQPVSENFIWAFACYHRNHEATATRLATFGPCCASIAIIIWKDGPVATYGVGTEEGYESQGYGLAVVSAATKWVLEQGEVATYGAYTTNIPSLRIAHRLGFQFTWQTIWA